MRKTPVQIVIVVLIALVVTSQASSSELVDARAPDFALHSVTGSTLRLSEFRSDIVLLSFSSERCSRCRQALPFLEGLYRQYQWDGLKVIGVDIDGDPKSASHVIAELGLTFPMLLDAGQSVSRLYDLNQMPLIVLIDREGMVRLVSKGFRGDSQAQISAGLARMLTD